LWEPTVDQEIEEEDEIEAEEEFGSAALTSLTDLSDRLGRDLTDTEIEQTLHAMSVSQNPDAVTAYEESFGHRDISGDANERRRFLQEVASDAIARSAAAGDEEPEESEGDNNWVMDERTVRTPEARKEATAIIASAAQQGQDPEDAFDDADEEGEDTK
jgi:hypothetical protein